MSAVRVITGSRLHFGLLRLPPSADWNDDGSRYYGGLGLMIDHPGVAVRVERAAEWSVTGCPADRARSAALRFTTAIKSEARFALDIERAPAEHIGLGTGTQLELAVAMGVSRTLGRSESAVELARILGRGRRSGIGVHGFGRGGFLVDRGKQRPSDIAQVERIEFPSDWRIALIAPTVSTQWHGDRETAAFAQVGAQCSARMDGLIDNSIVPALRAHDLSAFRAALREYNALAGEYFRSVQVGIYGDPAVRELVDQLGEYGAGQSSWGPTVFGIVATEADDVESALARCPNATTLDWTTARNRGAEVERQ